MLLENCVERPSVDMPDALLAQLTLDGNPRAFELLVLRYQTPIFNFIRHFLGDYDMACDISQQVFLRLYTSLPTLKTGDPFKAWLFQVARHSCIDELRRIHRHAIPFSLIDSKSSDAEMLNLDSIPDPQPSLEDLLERQDLQQLLRNAIASLPPKFRAVVSLRYAAQLKFSEIGRILGMPEPTAKTYFARAKLLLRKNLSGQMEVVSTGTA